MPSGLILSEGKPSTYTFSRQRVGNVLDGQRRRRSNESRDKDSRSTKCQRPFHRADERLEISATFCPQDGKLSLKANEPMVDQQHEDVERKWHITTLLFSLELLEISHQERRGQVKTIAMEQFNGILFHKSGTAYNQSIRICYLQFALPPPPNYMFRLGYSLLFGICIASLQMRQPICSDGNSTGIYLERVQNYHLNCQGIPRVLRTIFYLTLRSPSLTSQPVGRLVLR